MRSLTCAAGLLGAALLFSLPAAAADPPARVRLDEPALPRAWVQVIPLTAGKAKIFERFSGATLDLPGVPPGPALLCRGAEERATRCEKVALEPGRAVPFAAPPAGVQATGRILFARQPVPGAKVAVLIEIPGFFRNFVLPLAHDGKGLVRFVETAEDGRFLLPRLAPGEYRLQVLAPGGRVAQLGPVQVRDPARLHARIQEPPAGTPSPPLVDLGDLTLPEGAAMEVTVADTAGNPIAGAFVALTHSVKPEQRATFSFQNQTDARGVAPFLGLPPGEGLNVLCAANGYFSQQQTLAAPEARVRCTLSRPASLEGKIVDPEGKPVAAATVALRSSSHPPVRTAIDGTFHLKELRPGEHLLSVAAPGFRAAEREVRLNAEERRQLDPIQITPAGPFSGLVVDGTTEEPVAGAALTVLDPPGAGSAVSDAEGAFTLEAGSDEPLLVEVEAAGFPPTRLKITPEQQRSEEPVQVRLLPSGRIHVTAWDGEADSPCAGCRVELTGPTGKQDVLSTDSRGEVLSGPLEPGPYFVMADVAPYGENTREVRVRSGDTIRLAFGNPRATVEVVFSPPPPDTWSLIAEGALSDEVAERLPDGVFQVRRQAGETKPLGLTVRGELFLRLPTLTADFAAPVLRLPLPATVVRGILIRDGEPLAGQRVELVSRRSNQLAAWIRTAPDGSFHMPHLTPGPYQLLVANQPQADFEVAPGRPAELGSIVLDSGASR